MAVLHVGHAYPLLRVGELPGQAWGVAPAVFVQHQYENRSPSAQAWLQGETHGSH